MKRNFPHGARLPLRRGAWLLLGCGLLSLLAPCAAHARPDVEIRDARLRMSQPGFSSAVVFMTLKSRADAELVATSTPLAKSVELHQMVRSGSEVRMETLSRIALSAQQPLTLRMGEASFHLMVMQLKRQLKAGEQVPLMLQFQGGGGERITRRVMVRVVAGSHGQHGGEQDLH